ncbi:YbaB/EbfC family nucleoid-associated protein [Chloroflexota bacterium]
MAKGFKGGKKPSPTNMMGQLQKLQEQMQEIQAQLTEETVSSAAGGGAVTVTVTCDQRCQAIYIDPDMLQDVDAEMLQDMILTAVNSALDQSRELAAERMGPLTGGLPF